VALRALTDDLTTGTINRAQRRRKPSHRCNRHAAGHHQLLRADTGDHKYLLTAGLHSTSCSDTERVFDPSPEVSMRPGLWRAHDVAEMQAVLQSLPMYGWINAEVAVLERRHFRG
jgi:hypothetical protein